MAAPGTPLPRDRLIVLAALGALVLAAIAYLALIAGNGAAMPSGMAMPGMAMDAPPPWQRVAAVFAMWAAMMVGMMAPSVAPMLMLYARVARQARAQRQPFAPVGAFAGGYFLAWAGFSLTATMAQLWLQKAQSLSPMLALNSRPAAGAVLAIAGLYQWTGAKHACLSQCQSPLGFLARHGGFRAGLGGSIGLGLRHGAACVGCCWVLMALLFVGGVMNPLLIAAIAVLVLIEKLVSGKLVSRIAGAILLLGGAWLMALSLA